MTESELLLEFHKDAQRQGPGSEKETMKALNTIKLDKSREIKIADIGCGSGAQTITLAQNTNSHITAIDLFPEFLQRLEIKAKKAGLNDKIKTKVCSMEDLPFSDEEFDLIWSEGAIYIMGFENGIKEWKRFLKPNGYLAVTEISWITDSRPKELEAYWTKNYPWMNTIPNKLKQLENNGYQPVADFILPEYCWTENYYKPIKERIPEFSAKYQNDQTVLDFIASEYEEIKMYEKYKDYYSYAFYIAQKIEHS